MEELAVREWVTDFEKLFEGFESLLQYRSKLGMANDELATDLCDLYAIWGAYQIRSYLGSNPEFETALSPSEDEQQLLTPSERLPKHELIHKVSQDLLSAITAGDAYGVAHTLKEMRVLSFCPIPERVFDNMEKVALRVRGRVKQVFLAELSVFASAAGDYQRAAKYNEEARKFDLSSRELYDVCVIEGLIALHGGNVREAVQCLESSIRACQADVDSSIQCSLRAPNLELAEKLLEVGERIAVVNHLLECRNVWQLRRPQIESWIYDIENGDKPGFKSTDPLAHRLNVQWMRSCSLQMGVRPTKPHTPMSPAQVLVEREKQEAEFDHIMNRCVMEELEYLEKDLPDGSDKSRQAE